VTNEGVLQVHSLVVPYLDSLVPTGTDDNGILSIHVELHAADPIGVAILFYGKLALSDSVPDLEGLVSTS